MKANSELEKFILLSEFLTDKKDLYQKIAEEYLNRLELQFPAEVQNLLSELSKITSETSSQYWEFEFKRKVIENEKFSPIIQQILRIWYTGQFIVLDDKTDVRTREQFNEGLLWKIIHTEAPGADKGKKYGFWNDKPSTAK